MGLQDTTLTDWSLIKSAQVGSRRGRGGCGAMAAGPIRPSRTTYAPWRAARAERLPLLQRTPLTTRTEHALEHGHLANGQGGVARGMVGIAPDGGPSRARIYGAPDTGRLDSEAVPRSHL